MGVIVGDCAFMGRWRNVVIEVEVDIMVTTGSIVPRRKIAVKNCLVVGMDGIESVLECFADTVTNLYHGVKVGQVVEVDLLNVEWNLVDVEWQVRCLGIWRILHDHFISNHHGFSGNILDNIIGFNEG